MSQLSKSTYVVILAAIAIQNLAYAQDTLVVQPDAGASPVGANQSLSYATGTMQVTNYLGGILVGEPNGASPFWSLRVTPPTGRQLQVGCYERGARSGTAIRPGIDFSFGGSGCNATYGRYRVLELVRNQSGAPTALAVDFAVQCETYGKAVAGKIRFNSSIPNNDAHRAPVASSTGSLEFTAQPGAIGGTAPGGNGAIALTRPTTRPSRNFDNGPRIEYFGTLPGGGNGFWSLDMAPIEGQPFVAGSYPNATRFPFQAAGVPGLDFSYNGAGCNTLVGNFSVTDTSFDVLDGVPTRLLATFDQRCENTQGPLTTGIIDFTLDMKGPTISPAGDVITKAGFEDGDVVNLFSASCEWD